MMWCDKSSRTEWGSQAYMNTFKSTLRMAGVVLKNDIGIRRWRYQRIKLKLNLLRCFGIDSPLTLLWLLLTSLFTIYKIALCLRPFLFYLKFWLIKLNGGGREIVVRANCHRVYVSFYWNRLYFLTEYDSTKHLIKHYTANTGVCLFCLHLRHLVSSFCIPYKHASDIYRRALTVEYVVLYHSTADIIMSLVKRK